jgi:hypothetical protein
MQLRFDCRACDEVLKKERGCVDKGIIPFETEDGRIFRCPLKMVTEQSWQYVEAYHFYKKNLLPNGSMYQNETRKFIDAMMVLNGEYAKIEEEQARKLKR